MKAKVVPKILTLHTLPGYLLTCTVLVHPVYLYIKTHFVSVFPVIESGGVHWEEERESSAFDLISSWIRELMNCTLPLPALVFSYSVWCPFPA